MGDKPLFHLFAHPFGMAHRSGTPGTRKSAAGAPRPPRRCRCHREPVRPLPFFKCSTWWPHRFPDFPEFCTAGTPLCPGTGHAAASAASPGSSKTRAPCPPSPAGPRPPGSPFSFLAGPWRFGEFLFPFPGLCRTHTGNTQKGTPAFLPSYQGQVLGFGHVMGTPPGKRLGPPFGEPLRGRKIEWEVCLLPHVHYKRDKRDIRDKRDNLKNFFSTLAALHLCHPVSRFCPTWGSGEHLPPGSASGPPETWQGPARCR